MWRCLPASGQTASWPINTPVFTVYPDVKPFLSCFASESTGIPRFGRREAEVLKFWGSHQVTLKRWIVIAISFILTHGQFPGWRSPVSTGIVNHSWDSCVGVCRPSSSFARALPLPYCLGELDRCKRMSSPRGLSISHQHRLSGREEGGEPRCSDLGFSGFHSLHAHFFHIPFLSSAAIILSDSQTIWFVRLHD